MLDYFGCFSALVFNKIKKFLASPCDCVRELENGNTESSVTESKLRKDAKMARKEVMKFKTVLEFENIWTSNTGKNKCYCHQVAQHRQKTMPLHFQ